MILSDLMNTPVDSLTKNIIKNLSDTIPAAIDFMSFPWQKPFRLRGYTENDEYFNVDKYYVYLEELNIEKDTKNYDDIIITKD